MTEQHEQSAPSPNDRRLLRLAWWAIGLAILGITLPFLIPPSLLESTNAKLVFLVGLFAKGYVDSIFNLAAQDPTSYAVYDISTMVSMMIVIFSLLLVTHLLLKLRNNTLKPARNKLDISIFIVFVILFGIITYAVYIKTSMAMTANSLFHRRLMALAPSISEYEEKQILGQWAMMKSEAEYNKINNDLINLAKKYNTQLPSSAW
jgi:hypothetical protein